MDRYCPECNSSMTPSLVGYLCPDCGHLQRFYTDAAALSAPAAQKEESLSTSSNIEADQDKSSNHVATPDNAESKKIRSTLKRLMVPELPPPHHEQLIKASESADEPTALDESSNPLLQTNSNRSNPNDSAKAIKPTPRKHPVLWITIAALVLSTAGLAAIAYLYFR